MADLDIEALKRRRLTCRQGEPDCDYWAARQDAIIAALEDRDRLYRILYGKDGVYAVLRMECAEVDANDWPDDLHPSDVIEKHLARTYTARLRETLEDRDRLREAALAVIESYWTETDDGTMKDLRAALEGRDG